LLVFVSVFVSSVFVVELVSFFVSPLLILVLANENVGLVSPLLVVVSVLFMENENVGFVVVAKLIFANGLVFAAVVVDVCCVLLLLLPFFDLFVFIISLLFTAAVGTTSTIFSSLLDRVSFDGASTLTLSISFSSFINSNRRRRCSSHFFCAFCIRLRDERHGDEVDLAAVEDDILSLPTTLRTSYYLHSHNNLGYRFAIISFHFYEVNHVDSYYRSILESRP